MATFGKVMLLAQSGRRRDVKAIWLRRIRDSQQDDGGWTGVDIIGRLPMNSGRVIAWSGGSLYPRIVPAPVANFHATAQGLYLAALWLSSVHSGTASTESTDYLGEP
jgi:hypothetical protein